MIAEMRVHQTLDAEMHGCVRGMNCNGGIYASSIAPEDRMQSPRDWQRTTTVNTNKGRALACACLIKAFVPSWFNLFVHIIAVLHPLPFTPFTGT